MKSRGTTKELSVGSGFSLFPHSAFRIPPLALIRLVIALCSAWLLLGFPAEAAFYKYTDKSGRTRYVDELWKIPEEYRGQTGQYAEKFDHLTGEEKTRLIEADRERQERLEGERRGQIERQLEEQREREEADRKRQTELERQVRLKGAETRVRIANNQILVPVTLGNAGRESVAQLILDTGATHTVVYRSVASELNIITLAKGLSRVAGGQSVPTEVGKVDSLRVGPIVARDFPVVILSLEGAPAAYAGLLGMDFLSRVDYSIDYENQAIRWKLRER
jgi:hypothetical protein